MYVIIVSLLFLVFFAVYWHFLRHYDSRRNRKVYREIGESFRRVIKRHTLLISDLDRYGNRLIAMDRSEDRLVLIVHENGVTWEKCFNLNEVMFCRIVNKTNKISGRIQKVIMELTIRNSPGVVSFSFFDDERDKIRDLSRRSKKAHYWKRKIKYQLSARQINGFHFKEKFDFSRM